MPTKKVQVTKKKKKPGGPAQYEGYSLTGELNGESIDGLQLTIKPDFITAIPNNENRTNDETIITIKCKVEAANPDDDESIQKPKLVYEITIS